MFERGVRDRDAVVGFILAAQAAQDRGRLLDRRLFDHHRLETPLERGVGLDVFAVLVEGRRTDALQLAAGELGLDHRGEVEGTFSRPGTDERMQFVDEEDDVARAALDLVEDPLHAALELAAILRPRHERAERE